MISVFGSSGFIGSHYTSLFSDDVISIDRDKRIPKSDDILYLISTTTNYNIFSDLTLDVNTNLIVLMETLKNISPNNVFNYVSSWFVYGDGPKQLPAKETDYCHPKGFYSITKYAAEQMVISFCETFEIPWRVFRLANVFGIGDKYNKKKNALQFLIDKLHANEPIELYYNGNFIRDYIHVIDVCNAMQFLMNKAPVNEVYNIGNGIPLKFADIISFFYSSLKSTSEISEVEPPRFHKICQVKDMWLDTNKLTSLGFKCQLTLEDFLGEYLSGE